MRRIVSILITLLCILLVMHCTKNPLEPDNPTDSGTENTIVLTNTPSPTPMPTLGPLECAGVYYQYVSNVSAVAYDTNTISDTQLDRYYWMYESDGVTFDMLVHMVTTISEYDNSADTLIGEMTVYTVSNAGQPETNMLPIYFGNDVYYKMKWMLSGSVMTQLMTDYHSDTTVATADNMYTETNVFTKQ